MDDQVRLLHGRVSSPIPAISIFGRDGGSRTLKTFLPLSSEPSAFTVSPHPDYLAASLGFEPRITESESVVLPVTPQGNCLVAGGDLQRRLRVMSPAFYC